MDPFRILVVRLGAMGDVIHALPAVASLKHSFPHSHVSWVVRPRWMPLLEGNPFLDEIIPLERNMSGISAAWRRLRSDRFNLAVDFQGLVQSGLVTAAARADRVVGFHRSQAWERWASLFYSNEVTTSSAHIVDRNLELVTAAGASSILRTFPLPEGRSEGDLPAGKFVLASPLAGWGAKQWPLEMYADVAKRLDMPLVLNGSPDSAAALASVRGARVHLSGIAGLIDATRRAHAVIGVDSGPMHLAAALGKPGVAIFGPTDPARNGPYGGSLKVLRSGAAVTTYKRHANDETMRAVAPEAVVEALASLGCPA
ncbi:MAG TPA: glycosyltransferase family 9 protein [Bryobacteraceae bacterium]|nr:glycosyltransferase family 9 protein [Bryobacteraceae bacterium]